MARQCARPPAQLARLAEVVGEPAGRDKAAADRAALELAGGAGGDGGRGQLIQAVGRDARLDVLYRLGAEAEQVHAELLARRRDRPPGLAASSAGPCSS